MLPPTSRAAAVPGIAMAWAMMNLPLGAQPSAPQRAVIDRYPGITSVDPYRWMERPASASFSRWLTAQDEYTSQQLARLPGRADLASRVRAASRPDVAPRRVRRGGDHLFYLRRDADTVPPTLRTFDVASQVERPLPIVGAVARHDPSPNGRWLAVTPVEGGRVLLVSTAEARVVDSLPTDARLVGWRASADRILYQRPRRGIASILEHRIGSPISEDSVVLRAGATGAPRWRSTDDLIWRESASGRLVALQQLRDESVLAVHLSGDASRGWRRVGTTATELRDLAWFDDHLFLLDQAGVRRLDPITQRLDTIRHANGRALIAIAAARNALYLVEGVGATTALWRWRSGQTTLDSVPLPLDGTARAVYAAPEVDGVVVPIDRWLGDGGWYAIGEQSARRLLLTPHPPIRERYLVERRAVRRDDGVMVPMTVIRRRDLEPGQQRMTWVMAYGAYGIAMTPLYQSLGAALEPFLDDGGIYVVAHVRGGGEFGRQWHDAGRERNKPNGYRDLIACVESLIADHLALPARLVIEGASGGGATVGMAAATRPDLFRVVVTNVPDANTLRLHATPDGPFMLEEWGDIRTRRGTAALAAMDVTRHIRRDTNYPAWWATTGLQDASVPPWQPAKLIAHLQASRTERPAVLRVFPEEGHVLRPQAALALTIDLLAFALWQTGAPEFQPTSGR